MILKKKVFKVIIILLLSISCNYSFSQKLTLNQLILLKKNKIDYINDYLLNKGWEYHLSKKYDDHNMVIWDYGRGEYEKEKAEAWLVIHFYDNGKTLLSYECYNKSIYTSIKSEIELNKMGKYNSEINDDGIITDYVGSYYALSIKFVKKDYNNSYIFTLFSKDDYINYNFNKFIAEKVKEKQESGEEIPTFKYRSRLKDDVSKAPLRKGFNISSEVIYYCNNKSNIWVIDDSDEDYWKVYVNGNIGYLDTGFIVGGKSEKLSPEQMESLQEDSGESGYSDDESDGVKTLLKYIGEDTDSKTSRNLLQNTSYNTETKKIDYDNKSDFIDAPFDIPLRESPDVNSKEIYSCPKNSKIQILYGGNEAYQLISIDGHKGYVSRKFIRK